MGFTKYDVPALIIMGKIHFLLISDNEFCMKYNVTELQAFMEFKTPPFKKTLKPHKGHLSLNFPMSIIWPSQIITVPGDKNS